jgi:rod shape-determining protein MreD
MSARRTRVRVVLLFFLVALSLEVAPLPADLAPWRPPLLALTVVYWSLHQPGRYGVGVAWLLGLILDVMQGSILGQHALTLAITAYITIKLCQRLRVFPIWHQTVAVVIILAIYEFLNYWIDGMTDNLVGGLGELLPLVSALLLWPLMSGFSNRLLARS